MKPDQVRSLIRMGLHVGLASEHPPVVKLDDMVETLAAPIIAAFPTASRAELGPPETCGGRSQGAGDRFGAGCVGGCRCILDADVEHGVGKPLDGPPHTCRRGHTWRPE